MARSPRWPTHWLLSQHVSTVPSSGFPWGSPKFGFNLWVVGRPCGTHCNGSVMDCFKQCKFGPSRLTQSETHVQYMILCVYATMHHSFLPRSLKPCSSCSVQQDDCMNDTPCVYAMLCYAMLYHTVTCCEPQQITIPINQVPRCPASQEPKRQPLDASAAAGLPFAQHRASCVT
jgi:hypothetical protein